MSKGPRTVTLDASVCVANGSCSAVKRGKSDVMNYNTRSEAKGRLFRDSTLGCSKNPA